MKDIRRLNAETKLLIQHFGANRVDWDRDYQWVLIRDWSLPPGMNQQSTHVIILIPENYGNGEPLRDCFIDPDLQAINPATKRYEQVPHYFVKFPYARLQVGTKDEWHRKGWRYLCLHQKVASSQRINIMNYLSHLYKFLSEPFRDWEETFASYGGAR
jgi:hypothetical protein